VARIKSAISNRIYYLKKLLPTNAGLFMTEGIVCTLALSFSTTNNYLFLTRMGASDYQLSLVQFAPQTMNMLLLLPGGIVADSLSNKKRMVVFSLIMASAFYTAVSFSPFLGGAGRIWFILMYSLAAGMITLYGVSWQSFFPEVVPVNERNRTLTLRQTWRLVPAILVPVATGLILTSLDGIEAKITAHSSFYVIAAVIIIFQIFIFNKVKPSKPAPPMGVSLGNLKKAAALLIKNKKFLVFCATILVFYMAFHLDWTYYFIGQTRYLGMNETLLALTFVLEALAQFFTMRFWGRMNEKYGVTLPLFFGMLLIVLFSPAMIVATKIASPLNLYAFFAIYTAGSMGIATVTLNVFQCLLQVLQEEYKTVCISIFTVLTSLSNAVMPFVGVLIYNKLGADLRALHLTSWIVFAARIFAALLWLLRWFMTEKKTMKRAA